MDHIVQKALEVVGSLVPNYWKEQTNEQKKLTQQKLNGRSVDITSTNITRSANPLLNPALKDIFCAAICTLIANIYVF